MAIKNPTAHPGVILAAGRNMDSFSNYLNTVGAIVEKEKERRALKEKELDEALIPPEIDYNSLLPNDMPAITNMVNKDYMGMMLDYRGQGINALDPASGEPFIKQGEEKAEIERLTTLSNQHKITLKNAVDVISDPNKSKNIDREASMINIALLLDKELDILKREELLQQLGGTPIVQKKFNPYEYETDVLKKYTPTQKGGYTKDPNAPKGFDVLVGSETLSPAQAATAAADLLSNPEYQKQKQDDFSALSPQKQAEYTERVAGGDYKTALEAFVGEEVLAKTAKQTSQPYKQSKPNVTNINMGGDKEPTIEDPLLYRLAAMTTGDPQYAKKINIPGIEGQATMIEFPTHPIGTYRTRKPITDSEGKPVYKPDGEIDYQIVDQKEVIEAVFKVGDQWYISTNKSKDNKMGKRASGSFDYYVPITNPWDLYQYIAEFSGERNVKDAIKQLKAKGAWNEETGTPDWNKIGRGEATPNYEDELGF